MGTRGRSVAVSSTLDARNRTKRLAALIEFARAHNTYDSFQKGLKELDPAYDEGEFAIDVEPPQSHELIIERRENAYLGYDLLKLSNRTNKPEMFYKKPIRYLLMKGDKAVATVTAYPANRYVINPVIDLLVTSEKKKGVATFMINELLGDFPDAMYDDTISQEGWNFMVGSEGFNMEDFWHWAQDQEE